MSKQKYQMRTNYLRTQIQISALRLRMKARRSGSKVLDSIRSLFV